MSIASRTKVKYGLPNEPSPEKLRQFKRQVQANINSGRYATREQAGEAAAKAVFIGYQTHVYASEGDTLEMLLRQIKE